MTAVYSRKAMNGDKPLVSVGLPVYNGGRFLRDALDSLVQQSYNHFELVVCDNASTDATEEICRGYAARDKRIRYYRNAENLGAAANYNRCFKLSAGEYFKWAAHDDICAPDLLERCVEVMERDPSVVVCYGGQIDIDEGGNTLQKRPYGLNTELEHPHERFREVIRLRTSMPAIFGLIRAEVLGRTPLIGKYAASDKVLLAELALYGRFCEVEGELHLTRQHPERSVRAYPTRQAMTGWFDPAQAGRIVIPTLRLLREYLRAVNRAPLDWRTRMECRASLIVWLRYNRGRLAKDAVRAVRQVKQNLLPTATF